MSARRLRARWRSRRASAPPSAEDRWREFQLQVEPALAASPRVHRFAVPPVTGEAGLESAPLAVWVEDPEPLQAVDPQARSRTLDSLARGSRQAVAILDGDLRAALAGSRAERIVLLRAGDEVAPLALERLGQAAVLAGDAKLLTCDDDRLAADGGRVDPRVRPGPSPEHWLSSDDSGPLLAVRREAALAAVAELSGGAGWRHELALRLAGAGGQGHGHVPQFLLHGAAARPPERSLDLAALSAAMSSLGLGGRVEPAGAYRRIRRPLTAEPAVEVIVCFRDRPELVKRCVESLLAHTAYDRIAVALVDNGSVEPGTSELLDRYSRDPRIRVLRDERPFNYAALNNAAARTSDADALVFLNNDTEIVESEWLVILLEEAVRPDVGAVAPLLLYPDGLVQHAGAAVGLHGYAGHPFAGLTPDADTPFGRALGGTRNWLAVTAACMVVERRKFEAVGGFDESFIVAGNDVDLCLRLTAAGYRSLCVPDAVVIHDESRSRGTHVDPQDFVTSERSYGDFLTLGDPFYNPSLSLDETNCQLRIPGGAAS